VQKIDKIAMALAAGIIIGGFVWSLIGADPGTALTNEITEYSSKIERIIREQDGVSFGSPPSVDEHVADRFELPALSTFPEWTFYRRPSTYFVERTVLSIPPELMAGAIYRVEVLREKPDRIFQKVSGVRAATNETAEVIEERLEFAVDGTDDWQFAGVVSVGAEGEEFAFEISDLLSAGVAYQYRLVSRGKSTGKSPFQDGMETSVLSSPSVAVLYPLEEGWEVSAIQEGGLGAGGTVSPGRATIVRFLWDWKKMKVRRLTAFGVEGDGKTLFDTDLTLFQIRADMKPIGVILRGPSGRMTLQKGVNALPLDPAAWVSEDALSVNDDGSAESSIENSSGDAPSTVDRDSDDDSDDDADGGGLFGDD